MKQYVYPKNKNLSLKQKAKLREKMIKQDPTIKKITYSSIPGDCFIITR